MNRPNRASPSPCPRGTLFGDDVLRRAQPGGRHSDRAAGKLRRRHLDVAFVKDPCSITGVSSYCTI